MRRIRNTATLLLGLLLFTASSSNLHGEEFSFEKIQEKIQKTIKQVRPAVVRVSGRGSAFSGVIVSAEGHVLSAAHTVTPGRRYQVLLPDGKRLRAVGKGSNSRSDAAMLMITQPGDDLPFVSMGDSASMVTDQPVLGLSFPGGQKAGTEPVIRFGRVVRNSTRGMMQTTVLMEPGDSGGPLFDLNGSVVGIHSRIGKSVGQNYEVPVNTYRKLWNELNREAAFEQPGSRSTRQLGMRCRPSRGNGIRVRRISKGPASKAGIERDDLLLEIHGRKVDVVDELFSALDKAREDGVDTVKVLVERDDEEIELEMAIDFPQNEPAPEVALPDNDLPEVPKPQGFKELRSLAKQLEDLESKLDDACVEVISDAGDETSRSITGIRVNGEPWVISKSSVVGSNPRIEIDGESLPLSVVKRDKENDLVLLKADKNHALGIELSANTSVPAVGSFLLSPDADSGGIVSLLGSPAFHSRKQSGGFLGVMPTTWQQGQGARLDRIDSGPAKRAGLVVGDVITKLDDATIQTHWDMRNYLVSMDPEATITATVRRDEEELTKMITLGSRPVSSAHVANRMEKSGRRDGFQQVLSHDADLDPEECGGPLFDLQGNFVGLNIARHSRVRCYALPAATLLDFVNDSDKNGAE